MLLLDATIWVAAGMPANRHHEAAGAIVRDDRRPVGALDLTLYEVANAVGVQYAQPDQARKLSRVIHARCQDRLVSVDADLFDSIVAIAAEYGLTSYDAAYVAAARRHGWTLVSADFRDLVSKGLAVAPDAADYP